MNNKIVKKEVDGVIILSLNYQTIGTVNGNEINRLIQELIKEGSPNIGIDLKNVKNANSFGLSLFFRIKNKLKENQGDLAIININKHLQDLLKTAGLYDYFEFFTDEQDAIDYLSK